MFQFRRSCRKDADVCWLVSRASASITHFHVRTHIQHIITKCLSNSCQILYISKIWINTCTCSFLPRKIPNGSDKNNHYTYQHSHSIRLFKLWSFLSFGSTKNRWHCFHLLKIIKSYLCWCWVGNFKLVSEFYFVVVLHEFQFFCACDLPTWYSKISHPSVIQNLHASP